MSSTNTFLGRKFCSVAIALTLSLASPSFAQDSKSKSPPKSSTPSLLGVGTLLSETLTSIQLDGRTEMAKFATLGRHFDLKLRAKAIAYERDQLSHKVGRDFEKAWALEAELNQVKSELDQKDRKLTSTHIRTEDETLAHIRSTQKLRLRRDDIEQTLEPFQKAIARLAELKRSSAEYELFYEMRTQKKIASELIERLPISWRNEALDLNAAFRKWNISRGVEAFSGLVLATDFITALLSEYNGNGFVPFSNQAAGWIFSGSQPKSPSTEVRPPTNEISNSSSQLLR